MIEIINRKDMGGYASAGPAIKLVHTFNDGHIIEILKVWASDRSEKQIAALLKDAGITAPAKPDIMSTGSFFVSVDGANAPRYSHSSSGDATKEAERLATENPGKTVRILQQVGWRIGKAKVTLEGAP